MCVGRGFHIERLVESAGSVDADPIADETVGLLLALAAMRGCGFSIESSSGAQKARFILGVAGQGFQFLQDGFKYNALLPGTD